MDICHALMEVLPCLLPCSISHVTTAVLITCAENGNGFTLLWEILALSVPGFDPTLQILAPILEDFLNILDFCHAFLLYFRLQAKLGLFHDDRKRSCTFLWAIQHMEYVDVVTILQTHVETYMDSMSEYDSGYLPSHLCLVGLAQRIDKNWQSRVRDILPRVCCMQGFGASYDMVPPCLWYVQGYAPQVFRTNVGGRGHDTRGFSDRFDGGCDRDSQHDDRPPRFPARQHDPPLVVAMLALIIIDIRLIGTFNVTHANVLVMPQFRVICLRRPCSSQNI